MNVFMKVFIHAKPISLIHRFIVKREKDVLFLCHISVYLYVHGNLYRLSIKTRIQKKTKQQQFIMKNEMKNTHIYTHNFSSFLLDVVLYCSRHKF